MEGMFLVDIEKPIERLRAITSVEAINICVKKNIKQV